MKTIAEIDPTLPLSKKDFMTLFSHLPLLPDEKDRLRNDYFKIYETFVDADTEPTNAWLATRNIFLVKETQIGDRQKNKIIGVAGNQKKNI
jgi:hypothetical protein